MTGCSAGAFTFRYCRAKSPRDGSALSDCANAHATPSRMRASGNINLRAMTFIQNSSLSIVPQRAEPCSLSLRAGIQLITSEKLVLTKIVLRRRSGNDEAGTNDGRRTLEQGQVPGKMKLGARISKGAQRAPHTRITLHALKAGQRNGSV